MLFLSQALRNDLPALGQVLVPTPMVGGLVTSTVHTLVMIPALYAVVQGRRLRRELREGSVAEPDLAFEPLAPGASAHDSHTTR